MLSWARCLTQQALIFAQSRALVEGAGKLYYFYMEQHLATTGCPTLQPHPKQETVGTFNHLLTCCIALACFIPMFWCLLAALPVMLCRVPGVQLTDTLPQGACREDMHCGSDRLMCNITTTTGAVCICDPVSGSDTCNKYYSCERTPCARCSDCLSQVSVFTSGQLYNQDSASLAAAFSTFCNRTGTWSSLQCTAAAQAVSANKPSFGKRAGNLCQALGVCGAPGAPALPISCLLSVSVAATADRAAVQLAPATLDVCAVEGVVTGSDVPGTTRQLVLPTGEPDQALNSVAGLRSACCNSPQLHMRYANNYSCSAIHAVPNSRSPGADTVHAYVNALSVPCTTPAHSLT